MPSTSSRIGKWTATVALLGIGVLAIYGIAEISGGSHSAPIRIVSLARGAVGPSTGIATERIFEVHLECGDSSRTRALNQSFGHGLRCLRFAVDVWDATVDAKQIIVGRRAGSGVDSYFIKVSPEGLSYGGAGLVPGSLDMVDSRAMADSFTGWETYGHLHQPPGRLRYSRPSAYRELPRNLRGEHVYAVSGRVAYLNHCCFLPGMRIFPRPYFVAYFDARSNVLVGLKGDGWGMTLRKEIVEPVSRVPAGDLGV